MLSLQIFILEGRNGLYLYLMLKLYTKSMLHIPMILLRISLCLFAEISLMTSRSLKFFNMFTVTTLNLYFLNIIGISEGGTRGGCARIPPLQVREKAARAGQPALQY